MTFWVCSLALWLGASAAFWKQVLLARMFTCSYPSRQPLAGQGPQHRARTGPAVVYIGNSTVPIYL